MRDRRARERIDHAVHELHQAQLEIREGRPIDAARLGRIIDELIALKNNLRR